MKIKVDSLNPCSNGICSLTCGKLVINDKEAAASLNPCSNGICSLTSNGKGFLNYLENVLILVLMEYAL